MEEIIFVKLLAKGGFALVAGVIGMVAAFIGTIREASHKKEIKIDAGGTEFKVDVKNLNMQEANEIIEVLNKNLDATEKKA